MVTKLLYIETTSDEELDRVLRSLVGEVPTDAQSLPVVGHTTVRARLLSLDAPRPVSDDASAEGNASHNGHVVIREAPDETGDAAAGTGPRRGRPRDDGVAKTEVVRLRSYTRYSPESDPHCQMMVIDSEKWTLTDIEDLLEPRLVKTAVRSGKPSGGVNDSCYAFLVELARHMPQVYEKGAIRRELGLASGHELAGTVNSYAQWRSHRGLPDFIWRNESQGYYWIPRHIAAMIIKVHMSGGRSSSI